MTPIQRTAAALAISPLAAWADKYGIDEAMAESGEGSWGAVALVLIFFGYLYFKDK